jgi:DNA-binding MarR family transcriptional regulator
VRDTGRPSTDTALTAPREDLPITPAEHQDDANRSLADDLALFPGRRGGAKGRRPAGVAAGRAGTVGARGLGMHAIFFGLKRAHHGTLRITRDALGRMGLTAARFDMMYALKLGPKHGSRQSALRRALGVCRSTISRMLTSLEKIGLVTRAIDRVDRRRKVVALTTLGRWRIAFAHRQLTRSGWAQLAVDSALAGEGSKYHWSVPAQCIAATRLLDGLLNQLRRAYFDRAKLDYPWNPELIDEIDPIDIALDDPELLDDFI